MNASFLLRPLTAASALLALIFSCLLSSSCNLTSSTGNDNGYAAYHRYNVPVSRPQNLAATKVYVSLSTQTTYVMEGNRPLLVMPVTVGKASHRTPTGTFRIGEMTAKRRAYSHGFFRYGNQWVEGWTRDHYGREHVGTPMPYWCGLRERPAIGFHAEWLYPQPHSHGCIRMHRNVAPRFFAIVRPGTQVNIAQTQPWDSSLGAQMQRPPSPPPPYGFPEYPISQRMDDAFFTDHQPVQFD